MHNSKVFITYKCGYNSSYVLPLCELPFLVPSDIFFLISGEVGDYYEVFVLLYKGLA